MAQAGKIGSARRGGRLHDALAVALLAVLALSPLPLGANRPQYWLFWSAVILTLGGLYLLALGLRNRPLAVPVRWLLPEMLIFAAFIGWAIVQLLPLPVRFEAPAIAQALIREKPMSRISLASQAGALAALRWISYAALFTLMLQCARNGARARRIGWAIFLIVIAHATWALIAYRSGTGAAEAALAAGLPPQRGLSGPFANRNAMASFIGMGLVMGAALALNAMLRGRPSRPGRGRAWMHGLIAGGGMMHVLILLALALALMALMATGSRMGVASSLTALALSAALIARKRGISMRAIALSGAIGAALFAISLPWLGPYLFERALFALPDGSRRFAFYGQVLEMIGARPLLGYGLDAFPIAYEQVHRPPVSPDLVWSRAHSTYLALWSEAGIVAGSLPLAIMALWAWRMARALRRRRRDYALIAAALGALALAALHSSLDFSFEMPANAYLLLAMLALGIARSLPGSGRDPAVPPPAMPARRTKRVQARREADRTSPDPAHPARGRPGAEADTARPDMRPGKEARDAGVEGGPEADAAAGIAARFQAALKAQRRSSKMDE